MRPLLLLLVVFAYPILWTLFGLVTGHEFQCGPIRLRLWKSKDAP